LAASALSGVLVVALAACGRDSGRTGAESHDASASRPSIAAGVLSPDVAAKRSDGTAVRLADLRGQVVLLNLWATWCKPCRAEIPALEKLHREFQSQGLAVVGASLDADVGRVEVTGFARKLGATYAIWLDADDAIAAAFHPLGLPATFLVDRTGVIRWRHVGPVKADDPALRDALGQAFMR
jgi:peroxiredoxin